MKKIIAVLLCSFLLIPFTACSTEKQNDSNVSENTSSEAPSNSSENESSAITGGNSVQIPNPFVNCETLDKAAEIAGFSIAVPDSLVNEYPEQSIRAMKDTLIELIYHKDGNEIRIRKGSGSEDISGDFTDYPEVNSVSVDSIQVTMKGADKTVTAAVWTKEGYAYSVHIQEGTDSDSMSDIVRKIL